MQMAWHVDAHDVDAARQIVTSMQEDASVKVRISRNVAGCREAVTKDAVWMAMVGCLLTTQQRSGPGSAVHSLLNTQPFGLRLALCDVESDLGDFVRRTIRSYGGVRRGPTIAGQLEYNLRFFRADSAWVETKIRALDASHDSMLERKTSEEIANRIKGLGPKQSRNLLQWLGLTKYEIPIDSRILSWINSHLAGQQISAAALTDRPYYNFITDGIIELCRNADVLPCVLDAAVFAERDKGAWNQASLIAERLVNA